MNQSIPRALVVVTFLGVLCSAGPARAQAWLDSAWTFRTPITVTNSNGSTLTNFQVAVSLDSTFNFPGAKLDGSDLRVTGSNGTTALSFWVEKWNATTHQAKVWIKIPSLPAGNSTVYLYYGQPLATSIANGKNTFEMFDDFTSPASNGYYHLGPAQTIMTQDTAWEHEAPHTLSMVVAPTGAPYTYYGYYGLQGCSGIGIAGSNDLRNWTKFPSNPLFSGGGERWPHVLKTGSTYFMVHTINFCGTTSIVYRTSTNGTTWSGPTQMVAPQAGKRNQNPNLFQDPKTGLFHFYWYRGDDATLWTIMGRTASTLSGLASAPDQVLISSNQTLAAPNMMYRDSTYFLATEISEGVWKTVIFTAPGPMGPFTKQVGNPLMGDGSACLFQFPIGSSIYEYYCKETEAVWTLDMRVSDTTLGRQQIGVLDSTQWTKDGGDWHPLVTTQPNGQQGMVGQGSTNDEQILKTSYSASNYMLETSGKLIEGRTFGIGARGSNADNGYRLNLYDDLDGGQNLYLYRWHNGDATELWSTAVGAVNKDTWYTLGLRVNGSQLSVYFNGVLKTPSPITDTQFASGPVQLAGESSSLAQFDDVRVRKHANTEPASVRGSEEVLGNSRPIAAISAPANNSFYTSASVTLTSGSTDMQDPADSLKYRWDIERHRNADPAVITTFTTRNASFVPVLGADSAVVYYRVRLKVTDLGGLSDSTAVNIYPEVDLAPATLVVAPAAPNSADSLTLSVSLRNLGHVHTPLTHWMLRDGPVLLAQGDAAVAALDSVLVSRKVGPLTTGNHTLRFTADTLGVAFETSETNNASTRTINVVIAPGQNQPPVANATAAPSTGAAPLTVNFSSVGSSDPDNDSLSYAWNFGNGGNSTQANPTYVYTSSGVFASVLTVNDGRGGIARDTVIVTVAGASGFPTAGILDNFNRPDGALGAPWVDSVHGLGSMTISANALLQICCQYSSPVWNGAVFGPDQEAYFTFTTMTANAPEHDLMLKLQGTGDTGAHIEVRFDKTVPQVAVGTYDPATGWDSPAPPFAVDFAAGDQLGARAKSDGIVEVYKNGVLIGTADCSAWAYATQGGRIGLTLDQAYSSRLDNFGGGNVIAYTPPVITSTSPRPAGQVGVAYADTLRGSNGTLPYTWSVSAGTLPAGLSLAAPTGIVSGTPTSIGTSNFTIQLTDNASVSVTKAFAITIQPATLVVTSTSPRPTGQVGVAYSDTLKSSGGAGPRTWLISAGTLPAGLNLAASTGIISGMPTAFGTSNFTAQVMDSLSATATKALAITIQPATLVVTSTSPRPAGQVGVAYSDTLKSSGGAGPRTWSISAGTLPAGLNLAASTGIISGVPTNFGTSNFTAQVMDSLSATATKPLAITIQPATLIVTSTSPRPAGQVGVAYTDTLTSSGGAGPRTWSISAGTLPAGLNLAASTGIISGTPTNFGTSNFTAQVTDSLSATATKALAITIQPATLVVTSTSPRPAGQVGVAYTDTLKSSGGAGPRTWSISAGTLPAGLNLAASTGIISGVPTNFGTSNFTAQVMDSLLATATKPLAITIQPATLVVTSTSPRPAGQVGVAYSDTLKSSGGAGPRTWSISTGTLPSGLTLAASTGIISGTPTNFGTSNFTAQVTDSLSASATKPLAITIQPATLIVTSTSPRPAGQVGVAYTDTLKSSGGAGPRTWSISAGTLPAGLNLAASTGIISGVPTNFGTSNFTAQVTDSLSASATKPLAITIQPATLTITSTSPRPAGQVGVLYADTLAASGGAGTRTWSLAAGTLPAGLTLDAGSGAIGGTPTSFGTSKFTARVTDSLSVSATTPLEITIQPSQVVLNSTSPRPTGQVGTPYADTLTAGGGAPPYTWSVTAGALPAGLTLGASTGIIAGTPTAYGTANFTVQVADTASGSASTPFALTIVPAGLAITSVSPLPSPQVGSAYSYTLTAVGGTTPYTWAIASGVLPSGLELNASSGEISGAPLAPGPTSFRVRLVDAVGVRDSAELSMQVHPDGQAPVAWWRFEDGSGTSIHDVSGWANHGTAQGSTSWTAGLFGSALALHGGSDRGLVPDAPSLDPSAAITMATWIRPEQVADQILMSKAIESSTDGYELGLSASGKPFVRFNQAASGDAYRVDAVSSHPANGADWMYVAATYDGSEIRLYVNGVLDSALPATFTIAANNLSLALGAQGNGARAYKGALDEARLYARALASNEIAALAALPPVAVDPTRVPALTELAGAMPNPFRGTTTLQFALSHEGPAELAIYDVSGRRVVSLKRGIHPAGVHRVQWDGRDGAGNRVGAGVYFARLETANGGYSKRVIRVD